MYENWEVSFNCEKQSLLTAELKNLTTKQRKNSLACVLDARNEAELGSEGHL